MIHWSRVGELREEVGADNFNEVVEIFLEEVEEVIARLHSDAPAMLEENLHFLRGSAVNLGFDRFSELCQKGETLSANGDAADVNVPEIIRIFDQSRSAFLKALPNKFV